MVGRKGRSAEEEALLAKASRYTPGGTTGNMSMPAEHAMVIKEGRGSRIWDFSGNEYIDYLLGSGPMVLGHAHPSVVAAVRDYLERGSTYFVTNEPAILLAEEIVKAVSCADKVRFTISGSDATFFCMRLARAYRKRDKILKFEGGYHGSSDYTMMSVSPRSPQEYPQPAPGSAGIPGSVAGEVLVAPFNDLETTSAIIERYHDELAGVILEPFQRLISPKPGFLEGLREVTAHYGIPLIFDEVVTGFRFAYGGAQEYYGVVPDIAALGKIVGGGFPLGAVCGREEIMSHFDPATQDTDSFVPHVGTLSGNPVAAVAGLATLRELRREGTYERLFATGQEIKDALQRLLQEAEIPAQVVGIAPLFDVFFTDREVTDYRSTLTADVQMLKQFNQLLLEKGIFKGASKIYVSAAHTPEDVKETVSAFASAVDKLKG